MTSLDQEVEELRRMNNELAQKMQYWKMTAAQKENEKLELMKEINELRLKLSRLRSGGAAQARKLDRALQTTTEDAVTHLVQASNAITHTLELVKNYMTERQKLEATSQLNNSITSSNDKIHRVPPLLIGGRSIQPVVSLRRVTEWSTNHSGSVTHRPVPMHMLQDVYIPLTRIDTADLRMQSAENESEDNAGDMDNLDLEDNAEVIEEQQSMEEDQDFSTECRLDTVTEDEELNEQTPPPAPRIRTENPLEGPSWLLDVQQTNRSKSRTTLEPDSTTELEESVQYTSVYAISTPEITTRSDSPPAASTAGTATSHRNSPKEPSPQPGPSGVSATSRRRTRAPSPPPAHSPLLPCSLAPGVSARRRRRVASPPPPVPSPRPHGLKRANSPVLKVVVAKMCLEGGDGAEAPPAEPAAGASGASDEGISPPKRAPRFDAPSPNGATDAAVIVLSDLPHQESQNDRRDESRSRSRHRDKSRDNSRDNSPSHSHVNSRNKNRKIIHDHTRDKSRDRSRDKSRDNNRHKSSDNSRDKSHNNSRDYSRDNHDSHDSDSSGGGDTKPSFESRTRRPRQPITYKEKPLNRKLRR